MCVQTVGLIQAAIERSGITTVSISLLHEVTDIIRPPRALFVPYGLRFPLGEPNNPDLQHRTGSTNAERLILTSTLFPVPKSPMPRLNSITRRVCFFSTRQIIMFRKSRPYLPSRISIWLLKKAGSFYYLLSLSPFIGINL
jgi:hypothetical protein